MSVHPNDRLAALNWALARAIEHQQAGSDPLASLNVAALREMREEALRETRA